MGINMLMLDTGYDHYYLGGIYFGEEQKNMPWIMLGISALYSLN